MRLSAVVQLIDGFNDTPVVGVRPAFVLNGQPYHPHAKADGFYAFSELEDGDYQLTLLAPPFFSQRIDFSVPLRLPLAEAIVPCRLAPSPLYPYPAGTTLIRGQVLSASQRAPLAGVSVAARYQNWQSKPRDASTQTSDYGRYLGRYALALRGKLAAKTEVTLTFSKSGHATTEVQLVLEPATTHYVATELR